MFKVLKGASPTFMNDILGKTDIVEKSNTRSQSEFYNKGRTKTVNNGIETLRCLGPKIWDMIPAKMKQVQTVSCFKTKIRKWIPTNCPCRLCKNFVPNLGYI